MFRKKTGWVLLCATAFGWPASALAATYYVDPSAGNDVNSGTQAAPWKTIPGTRTASDSGWLRSAWGAISSSNRIKAGDVIEIKAGTSFTSSFAGRLLINSTFYDSGTSSSPITLAVSSTWGSGNVTYNGSGMSIGQWDAIVMLTQRDHIRLQGADNSRRLIINGGSRSKFGAIRSEGNYSASQNGVQFNYLNVTNASHGLLLGWSDNWTISNTIAHGNGSMGIDIGAATDYVTKNGVISDSEAYGNGYDDNGNASTDLAHGFGVYAGQNIRFLRCKAYQNGRDGFDFGTTTNSNDASVTVIDSASYDNGEDGFGLNAGDTPNVVGTFINTVAYNNGQAGWDIYHGPKAYLYHVVAHNNGGSSFGGNILAYSGVSQPTRITVKNSIFYKPRYAQFGSYTGNFPVVTSDNNIYVPRSSNSEVFSEQPFGSTQTYSSPPSWIGANDKLGTSFDPRFVAAGTSSFASNDYHLQSTSPAINAGQYLSSPSEAAKDKDGKVRGNPPEIGMYEYGTTTPPPTGTNQSIFTSQTPYFFNNDARYELGTRFKANVGGTVKAVRIYTNATESGVHTVQLWRADGTLLSGPHSWTIASGTAGWKTFTLPAAVSISANVDHIVSVSNSTDNIYAHTEGGFSSPISNGNLITYTGSGLFNTTLGSMPTSAYANSNYFRDIVFDAGTGGSGTEVIVDNTENSKVTLTGSWALSSYFPGYYGTNYLSDGNTGKGTKSARFTPNLPSAGNYEVFTRWSAYTDRANNVPIDITGTSGTQRVTVNQRTNGNQWVSLGIYNFSAGSGGNVLISNTGTSGFVIVDAVRFVKQ